MSLLPDVFDLRKGIFNHWTKAKQNSFCGRRGLSFIFEAQSKRMKVRLVLVGKTEGDYLKSGIAIYENRLKHYLPWEMVVVPGPKNTKNLSEAEQKKKEGEQILKLLESGDELILFDEKGKEFTSPGLAKFFQDRMNRSVKRVVLVVGGPYGFSEEVYRKAQGKIALSKLTFSHQMVRLFIVEQVYRAMTILRGEPYHHS